MELQDKIIVITGAGSGIGRALAIRFKVEGAKAIVSVDINLANAQATAEMVGGVAMSADVAKEEDIIRVIEETESTLGPIDLFCSNAGVGLAPSLDSPNSQWQMSWDINVMSHLFAARHMVPRMVARGGGYLLNTASAAG
ncbi:MAG: NAD(P)-dependent dehydrogenase (short-subunit alcohol dehydrogenase family), partial [Rheinheimera aquimaris]